ncbi:MAG: hypothetical protein QOK37_3279 [Thermoanaerobaculia bacterium]|jgi:rhomboid family GlyGly-CTERM serine protease|nr:hypothetical protein [Thermoanaerobaculia bacterium]
MVAVNSFALTTAASHGEIWRLWSGHLVHYDLAHALTNALAIVIPLGFLDRRCRRAILLSLTIIAPAMSVILLAGAKFDEYRGASGLAMAVWVASALMLLRGSDRATGLALLLLAIAKLGAELAGVGHVWTAVASLPLAHVIGAWAGVVVYLIVRTVSRGDAEGAEKNSASPREPAPCSIEAHPLKPRSIPLSIEA